MTVSTESGELAASLTELTRDLILIPSTESRPSERRRCLEFLGNHLDALSGIEVRYLEKEGYESLVAMPAGCDVPDILLCGHADVVDHPNQSSFRSKIADGKIWGPGAGDMKGMLSIMTHLFRHLHREESGTTLGIAITSDEEQGGENGVKFLIEEEGLRCGTAIIPDGGSLTEITVEEKGIVHATLTAKGYSGHAARPWLCVNALDRLRSALNRIEIEFTKLKEASSHEADSEDHWYPTCTVTVIKTPNVTTNRVPGTAIASLDIRFPPPLTIDSVSELIKSVIESDIELEVDVGAEPTHLDPDPRFLDITRRVTGESARLIRASGGSDARFFRAAGIPTLLSRPLVGNLHGEDEWINIDSMVAYYQICESYIHQYQARDKTSRTVNS